MLFRSSAGSLSRRWLEEGAMLTGEAEEVEEEWVFGGKVVSVMASEKLRRECMMSHGDVLD